MSDPPVAPPLRLSELADKSVSVLRGVGEARTESLASIGVETVLDMITHYPRRYIDRTRECRIADLKVGDEAVVVVTVKRVSKRVSRNRRVLVEAVMGDDTGSLHVVFFNQPWRERQLTVGLTVALFGKADVHQGGMQLANPIVDVLGDRTGRIVPIYPQSEKVRLSTFDIARFVEEALSRCRQRGIADPLPAEISERLGVVGRHRALMAIHTPDSMAEMMQARQRLVLDELLRIQLVLVLRKRWVAATARGISHRTDSELVRRFYARLPYSLTGAQQRVIDEITGDLAGSAPMNRLLQGDVGAGKTVVAIVALLMSVEGGHQGALMAPTEVLAEQHYTAMTALLADLSVPAGQGSLFADRPLSVELLTNRVTGATRKRVLAGLADGTVDVVVGTQALIQDKVAFRDLGVAVVDEQHRFGVAQRAVLRDRAGEFEPDVLVMTATPIPRTAAMTVYGDLDVSVLDELPPGRTPIVTTWCSGPLEEMTAWAQIRDEVAEGRQAYVVCPLVEESEKLEVASATETFEQLQHGELAGLRLALLHGRMSSDDKDATMGAFRRREFDVLVATTVIEVGVDVPNATVMVILDANRFGIAQLHQLRGRVGRGAHASRCYLFGAESPRIDAMVSTTDGFELAEIDLDLRGEGTLMADRQSGRNDLKLASLRRDREWVEQARSLAITLVDTGLDDPWRDELRLFIDAADEAWLTRS
jgi:ATP-dependent DNA helicase RecG